MPNRHFIICLLSALVIFIVCLSTSGCTVADSYWAMWANQWSFMQSMLTSEDSCQDTDDSAWPPADPAATPVYVSIVIHIEESFPQQADSFAAMRQNLIELAKICRANQLRFNLQPDWAFMTAMQEFETPSMLEQTNGKNILRYLAEDMNMEIDPHSHEHQYNYADIAYLINSCGVKPSHIAGGLISLPVKSCQLDRFLNPIHGLNYDYNWTAEYIWGGGTPGHVDEPVASGIWWPQSSQAYYVNDDGATIPAIGRYTGEIKDIYRLVGQIENGAAPAGQLYTACIMINQGTIKEETKELEAEISRLLAMQDAGQIKLVSLQELVDIWEKDFDSTGYIYLEEPRDLSDRPEKTPEKTPEKAPPQKD